MGADRIIIIISLINKTKEALTIEIGAFNPAEVLKSDCIFIEKILDELEHPIEDKIEWGVAITKDELEPVEILKNILQRKFSVIKDVDRKIGYSIGKPNIAANVIIQIPATNPETIEMQKILQWVEENSKDFRKIEVTHEDDGMVAMYRCNKTEDEKEGINAS